MSSTAAAHLQVWSRREMEEERRERVLVMESFRADGVGMGAWSDCGEE